MRGAEPSDAELIERSLRRPEDFAELFERHYDAIRRFAQRAIGTDAGEEVAAQTFLIAFERRTSYDPNYESARPWLFGIAHNMIRRHLRAERQERAHLAAQTDEAQDLDALDPQALEAARVAPVLMAALRALRIEDREPFVLVALGELSYQEAADALGVPIGTIRSRIHRAKEALRELPGLAAATTDGFSIEKPDDEMDPEGGEAR